MDTLGATIGSLFNVVRLFVLFDLISSGSRKNDNLWKSLGGIMVNGAPRPLGFSTDCPTIKMGPGHQLAAVDIRHRNRGVVARPPNSGHNIQPLY